LKLLDKGLIAQQIKEITGIDNLKIDEPMKNHTSFKVGGPADIIAFPENFNDLSGIIKMCKSYNIPFFILGNGTNLIVRDKGIRGVVIKINDKLNKFSVDGEIITAEAGILLSKLSKIALRHELSGLEFASGIPGTLGGAVTMNAGAYGGEMKDVVIRTEYLDMNGDLKIISGEEHRFGYRTSFIQQEKGIIVKTLIKLKYGKKEEIKSLMDELNNKRIDKQPLEKPSAGSVFKRPEGHFAGALVENCGLRGYKIGGAEVSSKHCGFIVNTGTATSEDVLSLINHIQLEVKEKFGVELQTEVRIVGEE
jgi:UDP-N-acetylmuramate dehydrogenase